MDKYSNKKLCGIELIYNAVFFLGYALWIISSHIDLSGYRALWGEDVYFTITEYAVVLLFVALILSLLINPMLKHPKVIGVFIVCVILAMVAQCHSIGIDSYEDLSYRCLFVENKIVDIVILVFAANKIDFRRICKWGAVFSFICLVFVVFSSYKGIIINGVRPDDERNRYYLGYTYPTHGAIFFVNIVFSLIYYVHEMKRKHTMLLIMILLGINVALFVLTDTRLPFLIVTVLLISYSISDILRVRFGLPASFLRGAVVVFPFCAAFSFITAILYDGTSKGFRLADKLLSGRVYLNNVAFSRYTPNLWGQQVIFENDQYNYFFIDNGYVYILLLYGVVLFVGIMIYYTCICWLATKRKDYMLLWWLVLYAGYNIIQHNLVGLVQTTYLSIWMLLENKTESEL